MPFHKLSLLTHPKASFFYSHTYCKKKKILYRDEDMLYLKCTVCGKYYKQIFGDDSDILLEFGESSDGLTFTYEELQLCLDLAAKKGE